ncbi:uncharacterized protein DUF4253 [Streptomyces sp. BK022]|uniref:DUF4253 domain-containing protein n=1 Tax=Streptomyces sp. BK022 TaxID=2512123 RepID=UPI001028FEA1|nr:DUF4253 domain-containing protein [Streptomyces sp. BK022]RZU36627.1 uncharacterized protein DUF4253 [Streptomyces sp. BK022]
MTTPSKPLTRLLTDPVGAVPGLSLPPGSLVIETNGGPWPEPLLWVADEVAAPGTWAEYLPARYAGLRPVLLQDEAGLEEWWDGQLDPGMVSDPDVHRAEEVLEDLWRSAASETEDDEDDEDAGETIAPFTGSWPGLASPGRTAADPEVTAADVAQALVGHSLMSPRIALVPVGRAADLPAAIGWSGPVNYEHDVARLCAVLRSWEDRFHVRVIALSYARLDLSVAAPPRTLEEALAVAAEHFAFCPDNIWQGYESIREYAEDALVGKAHWTFWWD